jgi:hypothetical protein
VLFGLDGVVLCWYLVLWWRLLVVGCGRWKKKWKRKWSI